MGVRPTRDALRNEYFQGKHAKPNANDGGSGVRARASNQAERTLENAAGEESYGRRSSGSGTPSSGAPYSDAQRNTKVMRADKSGSGHEASNAQGTKPRKAARGGRSSRRAKGKPRRPLKRITKRVSTLSESSRVDGIGLDENPYDFASWIFTPYQELRRRSHESTIDALGAAKGPFAHIVKWGRMEFRPLLNATRNFHEFAIFCGERAVGLERKAGRALDPICSQLLRLKGRWVRGLADDDELEEMRAVLLAYGEEAEHPLSRRAIHSVYYATSRTEIWKFAYQASQECIGIAGWRDRGQRTAERKIQDEFLRRSLFESQERRVQNNSECGVWSIVDEVEVVPSG